jgi:NADH-quinone oxidoreductase subunit L
MANAHHALEEVFTAPVPPMEVTLMGASVLLAAFGIILATLIYWKSPAIADKLASAFAPIHRLLFNKYYVDELYGAVFVRGLALGGGEALFSSDRYVIDGSGGSRFGPGLGVNGLAWLSRDVVARFSDFWDRWIVDGAVNVTASILDNMSYLFRAVQNGLVQTYVLAMILGILILIGLGGPRLLGLY